MHSQAAHDGADVVAYAVLLHSRLARTWGCRNYSLQFRVPPECHGDAPAMPSKRPMHSARSLCTSPALLSSRARGSQLRFVAFALLFGFLLLVTRMRTCFTRATMRFLFTFFHLLRRVIFFFSFSNVRLPRRVRESISWFENPGGHYSRRLFLLAPYVSLSLFLFFVLLYLPLCISLFSEQRNRWSAPRSRNLGARSTAPCSMTKRGSE